MRKNKWYSIKKDGLPPETGIYIICHVKEGHAEDGKMYTKETAGFNAENNKFYFTWIMEFLDKSKLVVNFENVTHWMLPSEPTV